MNAKGSLIKDLGDKCSDAICSIGNIFGNMRIAYNNNNKFSDVIHAGIGAKEGDNFSFKIGDKNYSTVKTGGAIAGLGIGYRFLSGGGVYRDKDGNTDFAGIPFV